MVRDFQATPDLMNDLDSFLWTISQLKLLFKFIALLVSIGFFDLLMLDSFIRDRVLY